MHSHIELGFLNPYNWCANQLPNEISTFTNHNLTFRAANFFYNIHRTVNHHVDCQSNNHEKYSGWHVVAQRGQTLQLTFEAYHDWGWIRMGNCRENMLLKTWKGLGGGIGSFTMVVRGKCQCQDWWQQRWVARRTLVMAKEADRVVILWNGLMDCGEQVWGITLKLLQ